MHRPALADQARVLRWLALVLLTGTIAVLSTACSLRPATSKPAVGDSCLVGSWSLDHEENQSGYLYAGVPVSVSGLKGAKLTLGADGAETETFAESSPLIGTIADGRVLSITIRGSFTFYVHADGHQFVQTGTVTPLPTTATIGGVAVPDYHSSYVPGRGTYECSQRNLTMTTTDGVQTDSWSRT